MLKQNLCTYTDFFWQPLQAHLLDRLCFLSSLIYHGSHVLVRACQRDKCNFSLLLQQMELVLHC